MITEIRTRHEMKQLKHKLLVRDDWHEPDEQGVTANLRGRSFDNAGLSDEKTVVLRQDGEVYKINLAMLLAWASGYDEASKHTCEGMDGRR